MNKQEAYIEMMNGNKVTNSYFTENEYLHIVNGVITAEDSVNFGRRFWEDSYLPDVKWTIKT